MTFGTLIPLILVVGVPIIIIMYLLKPKGEKKIIPSLLLWKNAEKNERSVTFARKLIRNILMFLEILALLLLMFAAMSPMIKRAGVVSEGSSVLVIDTSGSMQFKDANGRTRFEQAIRDAKDYVDMSSGEISIITSGAKDELLINGSRDKIRLKKCLSDIQAEDTAGDIIKTEGLISSLDVKNIYVFTDAKGAKSLSDIAERLSMDIKVYGKETTNVGITRTSLKRSQEGGYDIAVGYQVCGSDKVSFDISVFDENSDLIATKTIDSDKTSGNSALFLNKEVKGSYIKAEISSIKYQSDDITDGLECDDVSYAVIENVAASSAYLIGDGNIYFERAYQAATGESIIKAASESEIAAEDTKEKSLIAIYDKAELSDGKVAGIIQGYADKDSETLEGAIVSVKTEGLIEDTSDFSFGASDLNVLTVPDWATPFMMADDKVVGYFGEQNGIRQVILGFDIRNSEFPLMAEFPIFVADSVSYLTNSSMLSERYIQAGGVPNVRAGAGEKVTFKNVQVHGKSSGSKVNYSLSGLYNIKSESSDKNEYFVITFPASEGDGTGKAESLSFVKSPEYGTRISSLKTLCLILAFVILLIDWGIYAYRNRVKIGLELYIRIALLLLILLSIFGISIPTIKRKTATVFVVDMSDSNRGNLEEQKEFLSNVIPKMPQGEVFGIVTFGRNVITDQFLSDSQNYLEIATNPNGTATDIEGAVKYAAAMIPENRSGRIVVLTDGKETVGDISGCKNVLDERGIEFCARISEPQKIDDTYIEYVDMPEKLTAGDIYNIKLTVYSTYDTDAVIKVYDGSEVVDEKTVSLNRGENTFVMKETAGDSSIEKRQITVEAEGDQIEENNSVSAAAIVEAPDKVLLISGMNEDSSGFESLLEKLNINLNVVSAINAPSDVLGMLQYKTIIIDNCYVKDMPNGFAESLKTYVRDFGGGVVVTGGNESYAPGGYKDTPLEEILPVSMLPKGLDVAPSLAMVMVIDVSGSMEISGNYDPNSQGNERTKLDVAIDAAQEAVNNLTPNDYVGVVTFSSDFTWRQEIVNVENQDAICEKIEQIGVGGGTVIKPALADAVKKINEVDAGVKHILLLTDGEGETKDFGDVTKKMTENGITLSTIAVGSDSDTELLKKLAEDAGGRYYYSDTAGDVPKIFAEEVYLSGDTYFKNGEYDISLLSGSKLTSELYNDGLPKITGYVATSIKSGAREDMSTSEDDPLLASWQYGLGHTVAWTTNASGSWNEALTEQEDYPLMWKRIMDYTSMQNDIGGDDISVNRRKDKIEINYRAGDYSEETEVTGLYTTPSGKTGEIELIQTEPGLYSAEIEPEEKGVYSISAIRTENGEPAAASATIETVQFSDEYRADMSSENFETFVASNGRILDDSSDVFTRLKVNARAKNDISIYFILAAAVLLMLDIIFRRFAVAARIGRYINRKKAEREKKGQAAGHKSAAKKRDGRLENTAGNRVGDKAGNKVGNIAENTVMDSAENAPGSGNWETVNRQKNKNKETNLDEMQYNISDDQGKNSGLDTSALLKKKQDRNRGRY